MSDEPRLSKHAHRLMWRLLEDDGDGVAVTVIPSYRLLAATTGMRVGDWMAERAAILRSVDRGACESCASSAGTCTWPRARAPSWTTPAPTGSSVEWLHKDGHTMDALPPLDDLMPGRPRPPRTGNEGEATGARCCARAPDAAH